MTKHESEEGTNTVDLNDNNQISLLQNQVKTLKAVVNFYGILEKAKKKRYVIIKIRIAAKRTIG